MYGATRASTDKKNDIIKFFDPGFGGIYTIGLPFYGTGREQKSE
jgi:hypothetical protein